jgi:hypothetical protein
MTQAHLFSGTTLERPCTLDLEYTSDSLHAHVAIDGVELGPGDRVVLRDVDHRLRFGERRRCRAVALVTRAGWIRRQWFKAISMTQLTSLYDVSFSDRKRL